ncbi:serine/threonine-protein kinase [Halorhodospira sp. 9622]|uniref:serine/threonine-protein kinase n=1 Tax=Halorhodospira sp. 9622 TaxID=2899136 RepID=UPI001EE943A5|nr:serine/threonine-protein kinase [Halorhodospira sp. 9622]MCG5539355.1 serine/threonine protein kinase [Halorhodospira sp. 9622]
MSVPDTHHMALPPGCWLERYRIERELGHGGFGITYLGLDADDGCRVAIKEYIPREVAWRESGSTVQPISAGDAELFEWGLERFLDEARTLAKFDHPGIVGVRRVFRANETAYLVMEYCDGHVLDRMLAREKRLAGEHVAYLAERLLDALDTMHLMGVIHRDVKPGNILIRDDGSPLLLDFGSARQALGRRSQNLTSFITPHYAPLEQYSATSKQGPWTDLYGLAATLYHCLSGEKPPDAPQRMDGLELVPLARAAGDCPPGLARAVEAGLTVSAVDRVQSVPEWRRVAGS